MSKSVKQKISEIKDKIKLPPKVKRGLAGAAIVGGGALIGAGAKQYAEHQENKRINTEWKEQFQDADSVFADAKTAHFYASKKLNDDDVFQKRLYLRDLERTQIELQKIQLEEQAQKVEERFNQSLQRDLDSAIEEGDLQKIDKALERGAVVGQSEIHSVSDPEALFGPKKNAPEVMRAIFDKYNENSNEDFKYGESKFWGEVVENLEKRSFTDYAWNEFYEKSKAKVSAAKKKEDALAKEFREKELKGEIPTSVVYKGERFTIGGERKEYPVDLRYICFKHFKKLYPQGVYGFGYLSTDDKLASLNFEIQETKNIIESGHEYEIEAKPDEKLQVRSDVLKEFDGKLRRPEKIATLRAEADSINAIEQQKIQQEIDSLNAEEIKKGSNIRHVSLPMRSYASLSDASEGLVVHKVYNDGKTDGKIDDSGNEIKEVLKNKKGKSKLNLKDKFIDNER